MQISWGLTTHVQEVSSAHAHPAFLQATWWSATVAETHNVSRLSSIYLFVPAGIWILVSFRRSDWGRLLSFASTHSPRPRGSGAHAIGDQDGQLDGPKGRTEGGDAF